MNIINSFRGDYYFLSNMSPSTIRIGELTFDNLEAAFQAQKNPAEAHRFVGLSGFDAKKLGRTVELRKDWTLQRVAIMKWLVTEKFTQTPFLKHKLMGTQDALLIEGNTWNDTFWGMCNGVGQNMLGKILMQVRTELLQKGA